LPVRTAEEFDDTTSVPVVTVGIAAEVVVVVVVVVVSVVVSEVAVDGVLEAVSELVPLEVRSHAPPPMRIIATIMPISTF